MRINSARIKGYRIHKDTKVDFADGITLVSGPNESGKSTLAEAIRAALFVKARGRDTLHGRIGEGTTIELSLDVGDSRRAKVVKTFGGQGSVSVDISGAARMSDDDADRALAGILGGVEPLDRQRSTEGIDHVWGHLFVVQGRSGIMPVKDLSDGVRKDLRDALGRSSGGGSIVQSSEDGRVAEKVESIRDDLFTARGFRTGSAPQRAQAELETARETVEKARKAVEDRADLAGRIESAEHSLFEKDRQIGVVREKLDKARKALVGVKEAESELERFDHAAAEERKQWVRLSGLVEDLAKNDKEKGRLKTDKKRLQDEKEDIDSRCRSAESSRQTAFDELKAAKEVVSKEERDLAAVASRP